MEILGFSPGQMRPRGPKGYIYFAEVSVSYLFERKKQTKKAQLVIVGFDEQDAVDRLKNGLEKLERKFFGKAKTHPKILSVDDVIFLKTLGRTVYDLSLIL